MKIIIKDYKNIKKVKVASYARVSTLNESQSESLASQINYYTNLIKQNPNYEFVKVYSDNGISGTQTNNREGFMQMIDDACNGKIDIIICKSISRFGRNAYETQEIVRKLKLKNIEVIFEKENLSSLSPMSEVVFNFMTILAEEESVSISNNIRWSLDALAKKGIRKLGNNKVFGYDEIDGKLIPNKDSRFVKKIFIDYSKGKAIKKIVKELKDMNAVKVKKKTSLEYSDVLRILNNIIYAGDRIIQKHPHINPKTKKYDYTSPYTQYYVSNAHEAIISRELWDKCQKRIKNI